MIRIGPRLWKTGLSVALTVFLVRLTGHHYEVYGAVAAALSVAPSPARSLKTAIQQITANMLGGLVGSLAIMLFGPNPLIIGLVVVIILLLCQALHWKELSNVAVTVSLFVMAPHTDSVTTYTLWRLGSVLTGVVVGTAINALIYPPDYQSDTMTAMKRAGKELDRFLLGLARQLDFPEGYSKAEVVADAARVDSRIAEARRFALLMLDARRDLAPVKPVIDRAVKVLSSMLERGLFIHRASLTAMDAPEYPDQLPEIQDALAALVDYRRELYSNLLTPDREGTLASALAELELRFDAPIAPPENPASLGAFMGLYRMRYGIFYMANRLGRLYVAKETALPSL